MFVSEQYYEGKRAYKDGWERDENPYHEICPEWQDWLDGFDDAEGESQN